MLKNTLRVLVCLLYFAFVARAQDHVQGFHKAVKPSVAANVHHYVATHKRVLIADAIIIAAWSADAASSVHAQKSGCCVEGSIPFFGKHPTEAQTWGYAMGISALLVTGEHLIWWQGNKVDPEAARVFIWLPPITLGIMEFYNVKANAQYAGMAQARARVSK